MNYSNIDNFRDRQSRTDKLDNDGMEDLVVSWLQDD